MKSIKFLIDDPNDDDFFHIHTKISDTIYKIIKEEDIKKHSFVLGLFGEWGSGKSLTISKLKKNIKNGDEIIFLEIDVWKYSDTSLFRNILFDINKQLINIANDETTSFKNIKNDFKNGYVNEKGQTLKDILNNIVHSEPDSIKTDYKKTFKNIKEWFYDNTYLLVLVIFFILFIFIYNLPKDLTFFSLFKSYKKTIDLIFLIPSIFLFGKIIEIFLTNFTKKILKNNSISLIVSPPSFAQDQFEEIFIDIINRISSENKLKVVIVFDNLDRCESNLAIKTLSGLKTFLDVSGCFYIIPCDDEKLMDNIKYNEQLSTHDEASKEIPNRSKNTNHGIIDKIFRTYIRIPKLEIIARDKYINKCISESGIDLNQFNITDLEQILYFAYNGNTPREIKRFFNDFIANYKLAIEIDPNKGFLLKDIKSFSIMMVIKQKWSFFEQVLIETPSYFLDQLNLRDEINTNNNELNLFITNVLPFIDKNINVLQFIYLKKIEERDVQLKNWLLSDDLDISIEFSREDIKKIGTYFDQNYNKKLFYNKMRDNVLSYLVHKISTNEFNNDFNNLFTIFLNKTILIDIDKNWIFKNHNNFSILFIHKEWLNNNNTLFSDILISIIIENITREEAKTLYSDIIMKLEADDSNKLFRSNNIQNDVEFFYLTKYLSNDLNDKIPNDYISTQMNAFSGLNEALINALEECKNKNRLKSINNTLIRKIEEQLNTIINNGNDPIDTRIVKALHLADIKNDNEYTAKIKELIFTRINNILPHAVYNDVNQYITIMLKNTSDESLVLKLKESINSQNSNNIGNSNHFNEYIKNISIEDYIEIIQSGTFSNINSVIEIQNLWDILLVKFTPDEFINNISFFSNTSTNFIISSLNYIKDLDETVQKELEDKIINITKTINISELYDKYELFIDNIFNKENKYSIIEDIALYIISKQETPADSIEKVLYKISSLKYTDLINKLYENNKDYFLNVLNENLVNLLVAELNHDNKIILFNELIVSEKNKLKGNVLSSSLVSKFISNTSLSSTLTNKLVKFNLEEFIIELLNPERNDDWILIGIEIYKKSGLKSTSIITSIKELITQDGRNQEIIDKLSSIIK